MTLIVKKTLLESGSALSFSLSRTDKAPCLVYLSFNSTLKLIDVISTDHQKLVGYFNGKAMFAFFRNLLA